MHCQGPSTSHRSLLLFLHFAEEEECAADYWRNILSLHYFLRVFPYFRNGKILQLILEGSEGDRTCTVVLLGCRGGLRVWHLLWLGLCISNCGNCSCSTHAQAVKLLGCWCVTCHRCAAPSSPLSSESSLEPSHSASALTPQKIWKPFGGIRKLQFELDRLVHGAVFQNYVQLLPFQNEMFGSFESCFWFGRNLSLSLTLFYR